jgi:hypothetical protein
MGRFSASKEPTRLDIAVILPSAGTITHPAETHFDCLIVPQHNTQAMIHDRQDGDADVQYLVGIP